MKTIGRILIILLAATLVVGVTWALTRNGANTRFTPGGDRFRPEGGNFESQRFFPGQPPNGFNPNQRPEGFRDGGFERGRRGGFFLFGRLRNIGIIAVIVVVVIFAESFWNRARVNKTASATVEEPQIE
jgi:hypothetical protein